MFPIRLRQLLHCPDFESWRPVSDLPVLRFRQSSMVVSLCMEAQ